jgi:hypothetical protein
VGTSFFNRTAHRNPSHFDLRPDMHDHRASIRAFPLFPASVMMHLVIGLLDYRVGIEVDAQVDQRPEPLIAEADTFIRSMKQEPV